MKVISLIDKLQKYGLDTEIFLASDEEGNSFSEVDCLESFDMENEDGEVVHGIVIWPGGARDWEPIG